MVIIDFFDFLDQLIQSDVIEIFVATRLSEGKWTNEQWVPGTIEFDSRRRQYYFDAAAPKFTLMAGMMARRPSERAQFKEFDRVWKKHADQSAVDSLGCSQWRRAIQDWEQAGKPDDVAGWLAGWVWLDNQGT